MQVVPANVGDRTLSPEQFARYFKEMAMHFGEDSPNPSISFAPFTPGAKEQGGHKKPSPEEPVSNPEALKVYLETLLASSGIKIDELKEVVKEISPTTVAAPPVPRDAPERPSAPPSQAGLWAQDNELTQRAESASAAPARTKPSNYEDDDDSDEEPVSGCNDGLVNGASPVIITATDVSAIKKALKATTAIAFVNRLMTASLEGRIGAARLAFRLQALTASANVSDREALVASMGAVVKREHFKITRQDLDKISCELAVEEGLAKFVESALQETILGLEESNSESAQMAASMISNEMDRTPVSIDVANFAKVGASSLSSAIDTLTFVLFGSSVAELRTRARSLASSRSGGTARPAGAGFASAASAARARVRRRRRRALT